MNRLTNGKADKQTKYNYFPYSDLSSIIFLHLGQNLKTKNIREIEKKIDKIFKMTLL